MYTCNVICEFPLLLLRKNSHFALVHAGNYIVLWKRKSSVLSASSLKIVRDERIRVVDTSIEISQAAPKDSGVYLCEINTDPAINLSVKLDVLGKPNATYRLMNNAAYCSY